MTTSVRVLAWGGVLRDSSRRVDPIAILILGSPWASPHMPTPDWNHKTVEANPKCKGISRDVLVHIGYTGT